MKQTYLWILAIFLFMTACAPQSSSETAIAEKIVVDYYTALNTKDYQTMYGLISEGFKQIEPTAKTYAAFVPYMSKFFDTANRIEVRSTKVTSSTLTNIVVEYVAVIELKNGQNKELKSSFTIKKKTEGWRLIHPYGQNIDTSD